MRKGQIVIVILLGLVLSLGLSPASASAAATSAAAPAVAPAAAAPADHSAAAPAAAEDPAKLGYEWVLWDVYFSEAGCNRAGAMGVFAGAWISFRCENAGVFYALMVYIYVDDRTRQAV